MRIRTYLKNLSKTERDELASSVGTKPIYLYRIGGGYDRLPSPELACRIARASGGVVSLNKDYPALWGDVK